MSNNIMELTDVLLTMNQSKTQGERTRTQLRGLRTQLNNVIASSSLEGDVKTAINRVIEEQHLPLLMAQENAFFKIFHQTRDMNTAFMDLMNERNQEGVYNHDFLQDLEFDLGEIHDTWLESNDEYERIYASCADEINLRMPNNNAYLQNYEAARNHVRETRELLGGFNFSLSELDELLDNLESYIRQLEDAEEVDLRDSARYNLMVNSEFLNDMRDMNTSFENQEQATLQALRESWEGRCPFEVYMSLPHPITDAEWRAFRNFVYGVANDYDYMIQVVLGKRISDDGVMSDISEELLTLLLEESFGGVPLGDVLAFSSFIGHTRDGELGEAIGGELIPWGAGKLAGLIAKGLGASNPVVAIVGGLTPIAVNELRTGSLEEREAFHGENGEITMEIQRMSREIDWDWVEEHHPDWIGGLTPDLSIPELYELYRKYQNNNQPNNNSSSNRLSTPEVRQLINQGQFSSRGITFENTLTFTWWQPV